MLENYKILMFYGKLLINEFELFENSYLFLIALTVLICMKEMLKKSQKVNIILYVLLNLEYL